MARIRNLLVPAAAVLWALASMPAALRAQPGGMFRGSIEDPAIAYASAAVNNAVSEANARLAGGSVRLAFDGRSGYLRSALAALDISVDSQMLVFSPTSFQFPCAFFGYSLQQSPMKSRNASATGSSSLQALTIRLM